MVAARGAVGITAAGAGVDVESNDPTATRPPVNKQMHIPARIRTAMMISMTLTVVDIDFPPT